MHFREVGFLVNCLVKRFKKDGGIRCILVFIIENKLFVLVDKVLAKVRITALTCHVDHGEDVDTRILELGFRARAESFGQTLSIEMRSALNK